MHIPIDLNKMTRAMLLSEGFLLGGTSSFNAAAPDEAVRTELLRAKRNLFGLIGCASLQSCASLFAIGALLLTVWELGRHHRVPWLFPARASCPIWAGGNRPSLQMFTKSCTNVNNPENRRPLRPKLCLKLVCKVLIASAKE